MTRVIRACVAVVLSSSVAAFIGCSSSSPFGEKLNSSGAVLQGHVQGGQQAITGSTLQLYAVGTASDGSSATPLLTRTVTTSDGTNNASDSNANAGNNFNALPAGAFTISGDYTCPSSSTEVYLVATGGNPGLAAGTSNKGISMMAALGQCGQLGSSSYVFVDEVTTVGSVAALYPYMNGYASVGSATSDAGALASAFSQVNEFANTSTGLAPGPTLPAGYYGSSTEINTLSDIVAACINSAGGISGDGSACGTLFSLTKSGTGIAPTDVVGAVLQIMKTPAQNTAAIFNIGTASGPFQPTLASAPATWSLAIVPIPGTPTFSPAGGTYASSQTVSILDSDPTAIIYYTTNGSTPTTSSTVYSGAFTVSSTQTVQAIAVESARVSSAVGSASYVIASGTTTPVITSVTAIAAQQTQTITINGSGFGSLAAYTGTSNYISFIDSTKSFQAGYGFDTVTLAVSSWTNTQIVLQGFSGAYGQGSYYLSSGDSINLSIYNAPSGSGPGACNNIVVGAGATTCTTAGQTPAPTFSEAGASFSSPQLISINDSIAGSAIFYTTNGTTPTIASTPYTTPITVSSTETIQAIAVASGYTASTVAQATYTITDYGIMSTFAGNGVSGYSGDGGQATSAELVSPYALAMDSAGNIYTADYGGNRVRKITPAGIISTFAGNGTASSTGDGGQALNATLNGPNGVAVDSFGNIYIGEEHGARVRKVTPAGLISTIAGNGTEGYAGDGGQATSAELTDPENIAVDSSGNLYIADTYGNRIRKVTPAGLISTFAGTGTAGYNGDNIAATSAQLSAPYDVITDTLGNVYISDTNNCRVRKVNSAGTITTIAGTGSCTYGGDGGAATSAYISGAIQISLDTSGNLYIADQSNHRIRKVNSSGIISTIAGNGINGYSGDGGLATNAEMRNVEGVLTDPAGNVYIGDGGNSVLRKITYQGTTSTVATPTFTPVAGAYTTAQTVTISSTTPGASIFYTTNGATPGTTSALYTGPITVAASETVEAIAVLSGYTNSAVAAASYTIATATAAPTFTPAAGTYAQTQSVTISSATGPATIYYTLDGSVPTTSSTLYTAPITVSASQTINAVAISSGYTLSQVSSAAYVINTALGTITTVAGNGTSGFSGDGGAATGAQIYSPFGVAVDNLGNIYLADTSNNRIRKVTAAGIISTYAGTGTFGYTGDGGQATSATLNAPQAVALDAAGNLYIVDRSNNVIRKVTPAGVISTVAGTGTAGYNGDNISATTAQLNSPRYVAVDASGNLFITDSVNNRIRKVSAGVITTVAGNGTAGFAGDGSSATAAELFQPDGVAVDASGNLYIADLNNYRIRKVTSGGAISTIAGNSTSADSGDGGLASAAGISTPESICVDSAGNIFFGEYSADRIRKIAASTGIITTVAGGGSSTLDGVAATSAQLGTPFGLFVDNAGSIYITDASTERVRKVTYTAATAAATPSFSPGTGNYTSNQTVTISTATAGATIYYTTDGSTPSSASALYTGPVTVSGTETLSAIAYASGFTASTVGTAIYTFPPQTATPVLTLSGSSVTISDSTPGAVIYYTTLGMPTTSSPVYGGGPISVVGNGVTPVTINAVALAPGYTLSNIVSQGYTIPPAETAPYVSPNGGTFTSAQTVTLGDSDTTAAIYYTTDGTVPSKSSLSYYQPITVSASQTINAIAYPTGTAALHLTQSSVTTAVFTLNLTAATPSILPAGGVYTTVQTVTLASTTSTAKIYYTTDGSMPSALSNLYTGAITVSSSETINAIAVASGYANSSVAAAAYTINLPAAPTPYFIHGSGTYGSAVSEQILAGTGNLTLYYTTDGSTPTTSSTSCAAYCGLTINTTETIKVIATGAGYTPSAVASASYVFQVPNVVLGVSPDVSDFDVTMTFAATQSSAKIYYTKDGTTPTAASFLYTGEFQIQPTYGQSITIKAIGIEAGYTSSPVASYTASWNSVAGPTATFSPNPGSSTNSVSVTLGPASYGGYGTQIHYTTDGTTPTLASPIYAAPLVLTSTTTIAAFAVGTYTGPGYVQTATYTVTPAAQTPTFSVPSGVYTTAQTVAISSTTAGAAIYYTTTGTVPTTLSTLYTVPITVSSTETLQAIAVESGYANSAVASAGYTINIPTAVAPTFSPVNGTNLQTNYVNVTLSSPTPGASYFCQISGYGLNGGINWTSTNNFYFLFTPNLNLGGNNTVYNATIACTASAPNYNTSPVSQVTYYYPAQTI